MLDLHLFYSLPKNVVVIREDPDASAGIVLKLQKLNRWEPLHFVQFVLRSLDACGIDFRNFGEYFETW